MDFGEDNKIISIGGYVMTNRCPEYSNHAGRCRRKSCIHTITKMFPVCMKWTPELEAAAILLGRGRED